MIESGGQRLLRLLEQPVLDTVPKGWKTQAEICKEIGMSESQTGKMLRAAVKEGLMEVRMFRINLGVVIRPVAHYKKKG